MCSSAVALWVKDAMGGGRLDQALAGWHDDLATTPMLRERATTDTHQAMRQAAIQNLTSEWRDDPAKQNSENNL